MKRPKALFGILTITLALGVQVQAQSFLTNGLVAYYPFNGNANDASGNGNDGIVYGAILTVDRFGNAYSAYYFAGTNSYIRIPQTSSLNNLQNTTISYWIKHYKPTSGENNVAYTICDGNDGASPPGFFAYAGTNFITHFLAQWSVTDTHVSL